MKSMMKAVLIGVMVLLSACAVPPNETEAERAERINRGVTTGLALYLIAGLAFVAITVDALDQVDD